MPRDFPRSRRVGEQLQRELMELLRREVKDPRASGVTVTTVTVTRDLAYAKVFFTLLDGAEHAADVVKALNGAAGFLRTALGQRLRLRTVPQLRFTYDESIAHAAHMEALITRAVNSDEARHPQGATDEQDD